jgi:hypothetical protein
LWKKEEEEAASWTQIQEPQVLWDFYLLFVYILTSLKKSPPEHDIFAGFGGEEDSSARGSPSAMELTVGALNRLDKTLTEEITQFTTASAASARKAARHTAFRTSKASPGVSFDLPPSSGVDVEESMVALLPKQVSVRTSKHSMQTTVTTPMEFSRHQMQHEAQLEQLC